MSSIFLYDLSPGTTYNIQVRPVGSTGAWGPVYTFTTIGDGMPPAPVSNLLFESVGTSFTATWAPPSTDADGGPLNDFKDFKVTLTAGSQTAIYFTASARFDFTLEMNRSAFGLPKGTLTVTVQARDITGNLSDPVQASASNPPPATPTGLVATGIHEGINASWNANADADLDHYEVYAGTPGFAPSNATYQFSTNATSAIIVTASDYSTKEVKIAAVDVFGTISGFAVASATPTSSFTADVTAPTAPSSLTITGSSDPSDPSGGTVRAAVSWVKTSPESDLAGFLIRYKRSTDTNYNFVDIGDGTIRNAIIPGLAPGVVYNFGIQAYDFSANKSSVVTSDMAAVADSIAPSTPTAPTIAANTMLIQVTIPGTKASGGAMESDVKHYEVYASATSGFTANAATQVGIIPAAPAMVGAFPVPAGGGASQTWYAKIIAVDYSGNKSPASAQSSASVPLIQATNIQDATITNAKISDLAADKITAGTAFTQDLFVRSTFTIDSAGIMQSSNYSQFFTGWKFTNNSLEINQGSISASALTLQVGNNLMPGQYADFEFPSTFYTNSNFASLTVIGTVTPSIDATVAQFGTQSLKLVPTGGDYGTGVMFKRSDEAFNIPVDGGNAYIGSIYVKQNSGSTKNYYIRFRDNAAGSVNTDVAVAVPSGVLTRVSAVYHTNTTATAMYVGLVLPTTTTNVDGVQVERQTSASTSPAPWRPSAYTAIDGGLIRTGSIQSVTTTTYGGLTQPQWSINTQGGAVFADVLIRGHAIVGDASGTPGDQYLASYNYAANTAGWIIKADGSVEFNNGTFKGNLQVGSTVPASTISGAVPSATSASNLTGGTVSGNSAISGLLTVGSTGASHVEIGTNGAGESGFRVYGTNGTTKIVEFNTATGAATFTGNVTITGGTVPASTVSGTVANASFASSSSSATNATNLNGGGTIGSGSTYMNGYLMIGSYGSTRAEIGYNGGLSGIRLYSGSNPTPVVNLDVGSGSGTFTGDLTGSTFATAPSGQRVVISPAGSYGGQIQIWGGGVGETGPGGIYGGNGFFGDQLSIYSPTVNQTYGGNQAGLLLMPGGASYNQGLIWAVNGTFRVENRVEINNNDATQYIIAVKGASGQTHAHLRVTNYAGTLIANIDSAGNVQGTGAYTNLSDMNAKFDINYVKKGQSIDKIKGLTPATFQYIDAPGQTNVGFVAQDVLPVIPEAVKVLDDGRFGLQNEVITVHLVLALQEMTARVEALEAQLTHKK